MPPDKSAGRVLGVFGHHLRAWRKRRGMSQLELALAAGSTPRYVSFVETGRARPGRAVVLRLAGALDLPLREVNTLLVSAGLRPEYPARDLDDKVMKPVRQVVDALLRKHEPFPAWCMATGCRFLNCNRAAERLLPGLTRLSPMETVDFWYGPGPLRERVDNWQDVVHAGLAVLRREHNRCPNETSLALLNRALAHTRNLPPPSSDQDSAMACPIFLVNGARIRTLATVMRFDHATDVTASELKVELMFPADEESERFFRSMAGQEAALCSDRSAANRDPNA